MAAYIKFIPFYPAHLPNGTYSLHILTFKDPADLWA